MVFGVLSIAIFSAPHFTNKKMPSLVMFHQFFSIAWQRLGILKLYDFLFGNRFPYERSYVARSANDPYIGTPWLIGVSYGILWQWFGSSLAVAWE
jgi:hypothetical protein